MESNNAVIFLAAGGTGGHTFPAEALAAELQSRGYSDIHFLSDSRSLKYEQKFAGSVVHILSTRPFKGGIADKLKAVLYMALSILQAMRLILVHKAKVIVGFGGYPSFPVVIAAIILRRRTIIHEQNAVLGRANKKLAFLVNKIALSVEPTKKIPKSTRHKCVVTGNAVRPAVKAVADMPYPAFTGDGFFRILVVGGSQGASIFSQIVPSAIATLPQSLRESVRIDQQCRPTDLEITRVAYKEIGVSADLQSFFADLPVRMAAAHLIISRAGASSISEITVAGRPSILVPYAAAMDDHQTINAEILQRVGAAWVIPEGGLNAQSLAARIESVMTMPEMLTKTAAAAKSIGNIGASGNLADLIEKLTS
jgi:UDP-N-acetylglucosamine--N-acetylmuramyl-(pentapeptide) pyrophosphoryl-undecaprenol N-acetylglucosamine transferase